MAKLKITLAFVLAFSLSGCASFDMFGDLFSSRPDQPESNATAPAPKATPQQSAMNKPMADEPAVTNQQLKTMYDEWTTLKPRLAQAMNAGADVAALRQQVQKQEMKLASLEKAVQSRPAMTAPSSSSSSPMGTGKFSIQIAAASTRKAAEQAWQSQRRRFSSFLSQYPHDIAKLMSNNKEFYRVKVGSFATRAQANSACSSFQRIGGQCMVRAN